VEKPEKFTKISLKLAFKLVLVSLDDFRVI